MNELNSQFPTYEIQKKKKRKITAEQWFHLADEKNKLRFERLNFYHLANIMSSFTLYRRDAINGTF